MSQTRTNAVLTTTTGIEMKLSKPNLALDGRRERASVLIIVLWVCHRAGDIALYFANSMTLNCARRTTVSAASRRTRPSKARRAMSAMSFPITPRTARCRTARSSRARPCLSATRNSGSLAATPPARTIHRAAFGLIDEGFEIEFEQCQHERPFVSAEHDAGFREAILDWRGTNGIVSLDYATLGYLPKYAPFETVDELRLVYGADDGFARRRRRQPQRRARRE